LANLEEGIREIAEVVSNNAKVMTDCLYSLEAQNWVLKNVVQDFIVGRPVPRTSLGEIDYVPYQEKYKELVTKAEVKEEEGTVFPEGSIIFGGS
jgi:hypothetical protein